MYKDLRGNMFRRAKTKIKGVGSVLAPTRMTVLNPHTPAGDKVGKMAAEVLPQQLAWWGGGGRGTSWPDSRFLYFGPLYKNKKSSSVHCFSVEQSSLGNVAYVRNNKYGQSFLFKNSHHGHIFRALK